MLYIQSGDVFGSRPVFEMKFLEVNSQKQNIYIVVRTFNNEVSFKGLKYTQQPPSTPQHYYEKNNLLFDLVELEYEETD